MRGVLNDVRLVMYSKRIQFSDNLWIALSGGIVFAVHK